MFNGRFLVLGFLGFFWLGPLSLAQANDGYRVVVHKSNPIEAMTAERVSALFLKKVTKWDNGRRILPVNQVADTAVREKFSKTIHGKSVAAIKSYWQQQVFSGRDVPPPEKPSDSQVLAYIEANRDAIGYVSAGAPLGSAKVLKVTR